SLLLAADELEEPFVTRGTWAGGGGVRHARSIAAALGVARSGSWRGSTCGSRLGSGPAAGASSRRSRRQEVIEREVEGRVPEPEAVGQQAFGNDAGAREDGRVRQPTEDEPQQGRRNGEEGGPAEAQRDGAHQLRLP